eukprot:355187-Chlamydomonas_euryale.AAC.6
MTYSTLLSPPPRPTQIIVTFCLIEGNTAGGSGGGVALFEVYVRCEINNTLVRNNSARQYATSSSASVYADRLEQVWGA